MIFLSKVYNFRHSVGAILPVMPTLRQLEYLEIQRERSILYAKLQWKAFHLDENEFSKLRKNGPI
jgi:hypothetical protein